MRLALTLLLVLATFVTLGPTPLPAPAQDDACDAFDTQALAQVALDAPGAGDETRRDLDPEDDGIACPDLDLGRERNVPLADELPDDLVEAEVVDIVDGDTLKVRAKDGTVNVVQQTIRLKP